MSVKGDLNDYVNIRSAKAYAGGRLGRRAGRDGRRIRHGAADDAGHGAARARRHGAAADSRHGSRGCQRARGAYARAGGRAPRGGGSDASPQSKGESSRGRKIGSQVRITKAALDDFSRFEQNRTPGACRPMADITARRSIPAPSRRRCGRSASRGPRLSHTAVRSYHGRREKIRPAKRSANTNSPGPCVRPDQKRAIGGLRNGRSNARAVRPSASSKRRAPRNAANSAVLRPSFPSRQPGTRSPRQQCSQPSSPSRRCAIGFANGKPREVCAGPLQKSCADRHVARAYCPSGRLTRTCTRGGPQWPATSTSKTCSAAVRMAVSSLSPSNVSAGTRRRRSEHFFDDDLVPGTAGVQMALLRKVEPFPTRSDELKPYEPAYVRGWVAERYQVDLRRRQSENLHQMEASVRQLCASKVPGDTQRGPGGPTQFQGRTFKTSSCPCGWSVTLMAEERPDRSRLVDRRHRRRSSNQLRQSFLLHHSPPALIGAVAGAFFRAVATARNSARLRKEVIDAVRPQQSNFLPLPHGHGWLRL